MHLGILYTTPLFLPKENSRIPSVVLIAHPREISIWYMVIIWLQATRPRKQTYSQTTTTWKGDVPSTTAKQEEPRYGYVKHGIKPPTFQELTWRSACMCMGSISSAIPHIHKLQPANVQRRGPAKAGVVISTIPGCTRYFHKNEEMARWLLMAGENNYLALPTHCLKYCNDIITLKSGMYAYTRLRTTTN